MDTVYHMYSSSSKYSIEEVAKKADTSVPTMVKIRKILSEMKVLIIEGTSSGQNCYWNPAKCAVNPQLVSTVYLQFSKKRKNKVTKTKVKVENSNVKADCPLEVEDAVKLLIKAGFVGKIEKTSNVGFTLVIDLEKVKLD